VAFVVADAVVVFSSVIIFVSGDVESDLDAVIVASGKRMSWALPFRVMGTGLDDDDDAPVIPGLSTVREEEDCFLTSDVDDCKPPQAPPSGFVSIIVAVPKPPAPHTIKPSPRSDKCRSTFFTCAWCHHYSHYHYPACR